MGYDKEIGVCQCQVEDLEQICDSDCRVKYVDQTFILIYVSKKDDQENCNFISNF